MSKLNDRAFDEFTQPMEVFEATKNGCQDVRGYLCQACRDIRTADGWTVTAEAGWFSQPGHVDKCHDCTNSTTTKAAVQ